MNDLREIKYIFLSAKLLLFLNKMNFHMKVNLINKSKWFYSLEVVNLALEGLYFLRKNSFIFGRRKTNYVASN